MTDAELTKIYNDANGIPDGKAPPITTQRIFTAMRAMGGLAQAEREWMRSYELSLNTRAKVEQELIDCANGKRPLPDAEQCRAWAAKLGVPSWWAQRG